MKWRVWNWGNTRSFPFKKGKMIEIPKHSGVEINDKRVAEALSGYPYIEAKEIENFKGKTIQQLRKIASKKGISWIGLRKVDLIKQLSE